MTDTKIEIANKEVREKVCRIFGSEENYLWWCELNKMETANYYTQPWSSRNRPEKMKFEEDYIELYGETDNLEWLRPTYLLRTSPLGAIGWPQSYCKEFERKDHREYIEDDWTYYHPLWREARLPRKDSVNNSGQWRDYSSLGWPKSEGESIRLVSPEEDAEIQRRLKQTGLAKPGSNVPVEGYRLDALLAANIKKQEWIITEMLRAAGALMVYGGSGVGKSWFISTLILLIATGKGFTLKDAVGNTILSAGQHEGKRVCLVDGEMVAGDIAERISTLIKGFGLKPIVNDTTFEPINPEDFKQAIATQEIAERAIAEANPELDHTVGWEPELVEAAVAKLEEAWSNRVETLEGNTEGVEVDLSKVMVYARTAQDYRASMVSLVDEGSKSPIIEYALRNKIDVMVFDNVSTLSEGLSDENSSASFEPLNSLVVALKRHGVATVLVHHTGKAKESKSFRGSSNLATVLEQSIRLEAVDGPKEGARFRVVVDKNRNLEGLAIDGKTLVLKEGAWQIEEDAHANAQSVVEAIKSRRFTRQEDVGIALKLSQGTVSKAIKCAVTIGLVQDVQVKTWFKEARELAKDNCSFPKYDLEETLEDMGI